MTTTRTKYFIYGCMAAIAFAGATLFGPYLMNAASGTVCFYDGCVDFAEDGGAWLHTAVHYNSAQSFINAVEAAAAKEAGGITKEERNAQGLITYLACGNGVVASARYYDVPLSQGGTGGGGGGGGGSQTNQQQCTAGSLGYGCNSNVRIDLCTGERTQCYSCTGSGVCLPECRPLYKCVGDDLYYGDTTYSYCKENLVQHCAWGCSSDKCLPPPPPEAGITAVPILVRGGETSEISWTSKYTASCSVTENNPEIEDVWSGVAGTRESSALTRQTEYTLSCRGLDGSTIVKSVVVSVILVFQEQ